MIDNRDGKGTEYLSMPIEVIKEGDILVPDMDYIETEGLDGIIRGYMKITWKKPAHNNVKKYDVVGHIVVAGCEPSEMILEDGKAQCDEKSIYEVYHPIEEWVEKHIIELGEQSSSKELV